jgi:hypothetical protein
VIDEG